MPFIGCPDQGGASVFVYFVDVSTRASANDKQKHFVRPILTAIHMGVLPYLFTLLTLTRASVNNKRTHSVCLRAAAPHRGVKPSLALPSFTFTRNSPVTAVDMCYSLYLLLQTQRLAIHRTNVAKIYTRSHIAQHELEARLARAVPTRATPAVMLASLAGISEHGEDTV